MSLEFQETTWPLAHKISAGFNEICDPLGQPDSAVNTSVIRNAFLLTDLQLKPDRTLMLTLKIKLNSPTCLRNILSISVVAIVVHQHQRIQKECSANSKKIKKIILFTHWLSDDRWG